MQKVDIIKKNFSDWLKLDLKTNSGAISSYRRALELLTDILINNKKISSDIFLIFNSSELENIYLFVISEQKKEKGILRVKGAESYGRNGFYSAALRKYIDFINTNSRYKESNILVSLILCIKNANIYFDKSILSRFTSSLLTKPFVILTGLSGSGKTKLAQAFATWICEDKEQYALVPVGADWTNREPLLGYPNSLKNQQYVKPDTGVLDILVRANANYNENKKDLSKCKPYFLILDEMNLSHVERYFADFLSTMESGDEIKLYSGADRFAELDENENPIHSSKIPSKVLLPKNLFIVGTVNIDETTYMFSPKVLDRANTIEFRISREDLENFYANPNPVDLEAIRSNGKEQASIYMELAARYNIQIDRKSHKTILIEFFEQLQAAGAEFGFRTAQEMSELIAFLQYFGTSLDEAYDIAIMQKLLPKLHGSRSKLSKPLAALIKLCEDKYPISLEKLNRMLKNAEENGFTSYAEA